MAKQPRRPLRAEPVAPRGAPPPQKPRRGPQRPFWHPAIWWKPALRWLAVGAVWGAVALGLLVAFFAWDLPDVRKLHVVQKRPSVTLVTEQNAVIATFGDLYSEPATLAKLPPVLPQALLATEDRRFYRHFGIDVLGLARATWVNFRAGRAVQGGSTITQQVAKNVFLTPQRNLKRKVQEVLLAFWLEANFSKDEILELYFNRVYFGAGAYGIESAAQRYFAKPAARLTLPEAAMLVGMLKAPSRYSPISNLKLAQGRANQVIANMVDNGTLSPDAARSAFARPAQVARARESTRSARYFADWVLEGVADYVGRRTDDLVVVTTLDLRLQQTAEKAVDAALAKDGERLDAEQASLLSLQPGGAVRAMVGGRDFRDSEFNRVTQAHRQPGSAFKLFVFLAALEAGISPNDSFVDGPITVANWQPRNYDGAYAGTITFREAVARSTNTVAVQLSERVGRARVIEAAHRLGIVSDLKAHPSLALGASEVTMLELAGAYATLANRGASVQPYGIVEIRTQQGEVLYRRPPVSNGPVISERVLGQLTDLLQGVVTGGTGRAAQLDRPVAGKTGTSSDYRDAWFMGYTAELVTGVWTGNDDNSPMNKVTGGGLPAQIWKAFMQDALRGAPRQALPTAPADLEQQSVWQKVLGQFGGRPAAPASGTAPVLAPPPAAQQPMDR